MPRAKCVKAVAVPLSTGPHTHEALGKITSPNKKEKKNQKLLEGQKRFSLQGFVIFK